MFITSHRIASSSGPSCGFWHRNEDSVSWQKVDKNGNVIEEEEDDITQGNGNVDPNSGETPTTPEAPENPGTGGGDGDDSGVIS